MPARPADRVILDLALAAKLCCSVRGQSHERLRVSSKPATLRRSLPAVFMNGRLTEHAFCLPARAEGPLLLLAGRDRLSIRRVMGVESMVSMCRGSL